MVVPQPLARPQAAAQLGMQAASPVAASAAPRSPASGDRVMRTCCLNGGRLTPAVPCASGTPPRLPTAATLKPPLKPSGKKAAKRTGSVKVPPAGEVASLLRGRPTMLNVIVSSGGAEPTTSMVRQVPVAPAHGSGVESQPASSSSRAAQRVIATSRW
jgi:hypothetical protein